MKQYGDIVAALQGVDLSILQSLPSRLSAIEEKTPGLWGARDGDHFADAHEPTVVNDSVDARNNYYPDEQFTLPFSERNESLQAYFDDQNDKILRLEEQIKELKSAMLDSGKAYSSDIESLQKICRNLRSDIDMIPILDVPSHREGVHGAVPVNPDLTGALSEIQSRLQRKADNDTVTQLIRSTAQTKEGLEKVKLAMDELKQQVRSTTQPTSKRGSLMVSQPPAMDGTMIDVSSQKDIEVNPKIISEIIAEEKVKASVDGDLMNNRLKSVEEGLIALATQLAGKADRKDFNGLQIQLSLLESSHPNTLLPAMSTFHPESALMESTPSLLDQTLPNQETKEDINEHSLIQKEQSSGSSDQFAKKEDHTPAVQQNFQHEEVNCDMIPSNEVQKLKTAFVAFQLSLQKLQELISQKADRDELLQLHDSIYRQQKPEGSVSQLPFHLPLQYPQAPSHGSENIDNEAFKSLMLEVDSLNDKMKKLEERSDLNVLITKRLENFAQPAATVAENTESLNEVKAAINEHADRMMEYADTLLQMEALLASKADASGLQALRQSILELKKRSKESTLGIHPPLSGSISHTIQPSQYALAAEKVQQHEMMLDKLLKDMQLLGAGILVLSGHNYGENQGTEIEKKEQAGQEAQETNLEAYHIGGSIEEKHEKQNLLADGSAADVTHYPLTHADSKDHASQLNDEISGQPYGQISGQNETANTQNTIMEVEEALQERLIKPKGDADVVNKLAEEFLPLSNKLKELNDTLRNLQDNTAEKDELNKMKNYLKQRLDRAETAMFSGKGLPGFKCMSCAHRLEKLNPNRAEFVPTNSMPRQVLPMHSAERLYHRDGELDSPRALVTPPMGENQSKGFATNSKQLLSQGPLESLGGQSPVKSRPAKKK
ncbi:hypothetical protein KP509_07G067400 [Ceratopteris richardii]|nr:hypothetical protein KP509_07G067400 [Ceratopteris richardii]